MKPLPHTQPNEIGKKILRMVPAPSVGAAITLPAFLVLSRTGQPFTIWRGWRVVAGPTHCIVERKF